MSGSAVLGLVGALIIGAYLLYALLRGEEL
jgi:hypothetical protein